MIAYVWAQDEQGIIGKDKVLPWQLSNDLKHFKKVTEGHTILMGRKTFEGMDKKPLPNRKTLVLTRQDDYQAGDDQVEVVHSKDQALTYASGHGVDLYVIGGAGIFDLFLDQVDVLHQTVIHESFDGDTTMPDIDWDSFNQVSKAYYDQADGHNHSHTIYEYRRK